MTMCVIGAVVLFFYLLAASLGLLLVFIVEKNPYKAHSLAGNV